MATGRAAVVAEVTDVRRDVLVRSSATNAVLGVRSVLQGRPCRRGTVHPEDERVRPLPRELADLRIVAVHRQRRILGERAHRRTPPLRDVLELAVAVELVAKEIPEADGFRFDTQEDLGQCRLVHLEEAELGRACVEERRGHPRDQVRARPVVRQAKTFTENACRHRRGRRLAVRRGDHRRAERQPRGEAVDRSGIELPDQLSGDCRAAAGPSQTG